MNVLHSYNWKLELNYNIIIENRNVASTNMFICILKIKTLPLTCCLIEPVVKTFPFHQLAMTRNYSRLHGRNILQHVNTFILILSPTTM